MIGSSLIVSLIYLKGRSRDFPSADSLPRCLWARPKPRAGNSVQVSHVGGRDPSTWAVTCCLPGWASGAEPGVERRHFHVGRPCAPCCVNWNSLLHVFLRGDRGPVASLQSPQPGAHRACEHFSSRRLRGLGSGLRCGFVITLSQEAVFCPKSSVCSAKLLSCFQ